MARTGSDLCGFFHQIRRHKGRTIAVSIFMKPQHTKHSNSMLYYNNIIINLLNLETLPYQITPFRIISQRSGTALPVPASTVSSSRATFFPPHPTKFPVNSFLLFIFFFSPGCLRPCSLLLLTYKRPLLGPSSLYFLPPFLSVPVFYSSSISTSSSDIHGYLTPADL